MKIYDPARSMRSAIPLIVLFLLLAASLACSVAIGPIAPPTSTETTVPSPVPSATPRLPPAILYSEDFSDSYSGWITGTPADNPESTFQYLDGEYIMTRNKGLDNVNWAFAHQDFSDSVISVDVRHIAGDTNATGPVIFWRVSQDLQNFYWLLVYGNGQFSIQKVSHGVGSIIQAWGPSPAILRGLKVNHIDIKSVGDQNTIYINGTQVAAFTDSASLHGDIALGVTSTVQSEIEAAFDNLIVYSPENWEPAQGQ